MRLSEAGRGVISTQLEGGPESLQDHARLGGKEGISATRAAMAFLGG